MSGADEVPVHRFRPRFTPAQKNELRGRLRITEAQVHSLEFELSAVAPWLQPQARTRDVRDELEDMNRSLSAAARRLKLWRDAASRRGAHGTPTAMAEAFGHFSIAAAGMRAFGGCGIDLHDDLDPASIISMAACIANRALEQAPFRKRNLVRAAPEAIRIIVRALGKPGDEWSRERASALSPARTGDFAAVARIVWTAVLGQSSATPTRSIQAFLKAQG